MNLAYLRHQRDRARRGEDFKALRNCHVKGLLSVVLHDQPGNRVRMFVAPHGHGLGFRETLSLAIHPHHCDLTLIGLYGNAQNDVYALTPHATGTHAEYEYRSAITTGKGSMEPTGERAYVHRLSSETIGPDGIQMPAWMLHSVYLPFFSEAAWIVVEGASDADYRSRCWTNGSVDLSELYVPMDSEEVTALFDRVIYNMEKPSA